MAKRHPQSPTSFRFGEKKFAKTQQLQPELKAGNLFFS